MRDRERMIGEWGNAISKWGGIEINDQRMDGEYAVSASRFMLQVAPLWS